MAKLIDIVSEVHEKLLGFETEKAQTYSLIDQLDQFLNSSDSALDGQWLTLKTSAESLLNQINSLETNFVDETQAMIEELETLKTKLDEFITENEEATNNLKEDMVNLVEKMRDNSEDINTELEELETIVNSFKTNVPKIEQPLTEKLQNTTDFLNNILLKELQDYREIIDKQHEELENFYQENINETFANQLQDLMTDLDDFEQDVNNLKDEAETIVDDIEETLNNFYTGNSHKLKSKYQEIFESLEDKLVKGIKDNHKKVEEHTTQLSELLEGISNHYQDTNESVESIIKIYENLVN